MSEKSDLRARAEYALGCLVIKVALAAGFVGFALGFGLAAVAFALAGVL